jgi:hypothetical protein
MNGIALEGSQASSAHYLGKHYGESSGVAVANHDDFGVQPMIPVSVKQYGGGGTFGNSRPLGPLPPIQPRPATQQHIADQIASLEKNITQNLESIIKNSIDKSSLHAKRKASRRKQLRAHGGVAPGNNDMNEGNELDDQLLSPMKVKGDRPNSSSSRRSKRKNKRGENNDFSMGEAGPGLSARGIGGNDTTGARPGSAKMMDADAELDPNFLENAEGFHHLGRGIGGADPAQAMSGKYDGTDDMPPEAAMSTMQSMGLGLASPGMDGSAKYDPENKDFHIDEDAENLKRMQGKAYRSGPGSRLPAPDAKKSGKFGEDPERIERRQIYKKKPEVDPQFPDWH